ncbi:hypothetical protein BFJ70_g7002 [Fusarium oxysporum]|uniref:Uncharacterized protein n=1 Tax=Fusarium oxysporum TaxID=5507 RepID=A0A420T7C9_FUSOX|nr:hypothetical protein BFJ68_g13463 [Fusarium oxysporum]RKL37430.1 hypothetical protein BFJ70_g7002 [Fusarium oxysporum]
MQAASKLKFKVRAELMARYRDAVTLLRVLQALMACDNEYSCNCK